MFFLACHFAHHTRHKTIDKGRCSQHYFGGCGWQPAGRSVLPVALPSPVTLQKTSPNPAGNHPGRPVRALTTQVQRHTSVCGCESTTWRSRGTHGNFIYILRLRCRATLSLPSDSSPLVVHATTFNSPSQTSAVDIWPVWLEHPWLCCHLFMRVKPSEARTMFGAWRIYPDCLTLMCLPRVQGLGNCTNLLPRYLKSYGKKALKSGFL